MKERRLEIIGILLITLSIFVLVSLIGYQPNEEPTISQDVRIENPMGILGVGVAHYLIKAGIGYVAFILPVLGLVWGWWLFGTKPLQPLVRASGYLLGAVFLISVTLGVSTYIFGHGGPLSIRIPGLIGGLVARLLTDFLGLIGTVLVVLAAWLVLLRGYFNWSFYAPVQLVQKHAKAWWDLRQEKKAERTAEQAKREHTEKLRAKLEAQQEPEPSSPPAAEKPQTESSRKDEDESDQDTDDLIAKAQRLSIAQSAKSEVESESKQVDEPSTPEPISVEDNESEETPEPKVTEEEIEVGEMVVEEKVDLDELKERRTPKRQFQLPTTDLLTDPPPVDESMSRDELLERAAFLTQSLSTFGVEGKVVNVHPGPIITLFEVEPAEGVRVNKFVQLADDLARVMEASRVRVIAPIPGRSSVGIEIPNTNPATVYFKSVINSEKFANAKSKLTLAIGKNTSGEIATMDLAGMPHLLIAGTTGSGKSVCLNTIICSMLYRATPEELKFIIIDPKKVEMSLYRALQGYHLLGLEDVEEPIVTSTDNAILALRSLEKEMDRRYTAMAEAGVRNIDEYNTKMRKQDEGIMPYLVLIVDELADLMMMSAKDVEAPIARLAQLSRAVGIHLVIATQRPSVDVITGVIKANFPARIAFQVATKIDSRTILDTQGAEKLIGRGDMLYQGPGSSEAVRLHNAYITLDEIESIMDFIKEQPEAEELKLESIRETTVDGMTIENGEEDELLTEAIKLIVTHQQGSISLLQRRLKIGYSRAARLIDDMEKLGIVGPFTGSKARDVLVDESYLLSIE